MGRRTKEDRPTNHPKPKKSIDTVLADAVVQKYTELADHLLKSETVSPVDGSDPEDKEN